MFVEFDFRNFSTHSFAVGNVSSLRGIQLYIYDGNSVRKKEWVPNFPLISHPWTLFANGDATVCSQIQQAQETPQTKPERYGRHKP